MATLADRRRYERSGLTTVETALVLPLVLLLTFGVIEYGWLLMKCQQVNGVARHAARVASLQGAHDADVDVAVDNGLTKAGIKVANVRSVYEITGVVEVGRELTLTLTVPYTSLLKYSVLPVPENLRASMTIVREGPSPS